MGDKSVEIPSTPTTSSSGGIDNRREIINIPLHQDKLLKDPPPPKSEPENITTNINNRNPGSLGGRSRRSSAKKRASHRKPRSAKKRATRRYRRRHRHA